MLLVYYKHWSSPQRMNHDAHMHEYKSLLLFIQQKGTYLMNIKYIS